MTTSTTTAPRQGDVVYASLHVPDADRAAAFFGEVVGWTYSVDRHHQIDGLSIHHGLMGGVDHATLLLCFAVGDLEAVLDRVAAAGGQPGPIDDEPFGRTSLCTDDQGMRFALNEGPIGEGLPEPDRSGDLVHITMEVMDSGKARAFYGTVLGWQFESGHVDDGWMIQSPTPGMGMAGGRTPATVVPMYAVDDIGASVAAVRRLGGTSSDPEERPYGIAAECHDDQGTHFYLMQR
jgi:predicted enzyme related to lactoylglutathione lyase